MDRVDLFEQPDQRVRVLDRLQLDPALLDATHTNLGLLHRNFASHRTDRNVDRVGVVLDKLVAIGDPLSRRRCS